MYKPEPCKYTNVHHAEFSYGITEKTWLWNSLSTLFLFSFSKFTLYFSLCISLPRKQKYFPLFDYMLNHYQLTFYHPIAVLKLNIQDQENLTAFSTLTAEEKSTHTYLLMPKWTKHNMWTETEHITIGSCTENALLAFGKGKNIFIINHEAG